MDRLWVSTKVSLWGNHVRLETDSLGEGWLVLSNPAASLLHYRKPSGKHQVGSIVSGSKLRPQMSGDHSIFPLNIRVKAR